ncbi:hypothetical protein ACT3RU_13430 [Halomonas sp. TP35]
MADFKQREWVKLKWADHWAEGQVIHKDSEKPHPAYLIKQENGSTVLKALF